VSELDARLQEAMEASCRMGERAEAGDWESAASGAELVRRILCDELAVSQLREAGQSHREILTELMRRTQALTEKAQTRREALTRERAELSRNRGAIVHYASTSG
jgi:predicted ATP-grasp superfamily ATP-dependent carboligase